MGWQPIKQACRISDDELLMSDEWMGPWAIIRRLKFGDEVWYRAVTPEPARTERQLIGYSQNLRQLAFQAYRRFLHTRGTNTGPVNGWGREKAQPLTSADDIPIDTANPQEVTTAGSLHSSHAP